MDENINENLKRFMAELDALEQDDLDEDTFHGHKLDAVQWGVYQRIVKALEDLPDKDDNVLTLDYLEVPCPSDRMATVTIAIPQAAMFASETKNALATAVMLCDRWYIMAMGDKVRLSFVVGNVWME